LLAEESTQATSAKRAGLAVRVSLATVFTVFAEARALTEAAVRVRIAALLAVAALRAAGVPVVVDALWIAKRASARLTGRRVARITVQTGRPVR
jgi:hypothetical protein